MLEKLYDELNKFHDFKIEKISLESITKKEEELGVKFPESMEDFYCYYENCKGIRDAFYFISDLGDVHIENSGLAFGYKKNKRDILGIKLKDLNGKWQSISYNKPGEKTWYMEGAIMAECFFFNIVAWHIMNLMPYVVKVKMSKEKVIKLCEEEFSFFSEKKIINMGYRVYSCRKNDILGCYLVEDGELYLGARTKEELYMLEEKYGWKLTADKLS